MKDTSRQSALTSIALLWILVCAVACAGAEPLPTATLWETWGESVHTVAVAPDGTVWASIREYGHVDIATSVSRGTGLARYDGKWTTYTAADGLPSADIDPMAVSAEGALWFGTSTGVTRFDGKSWTTYTEGDGLAEGPVSAIAVAPDGALWFGAVGSISLDREGRARIEDRGGVSRFDGKTWTTYTTADGLPGDLDGVAVIEEIAVTADGVVWVGTSSSGVSCFDGVSWTTYTTDDGLADDAVNDVAVAPDGKVWIATNGGVSCYDQATARTASPVEAWTTYGLEEGLSEGGVRSIEVAPDGTVWVSYWGWTGGISRFDGKWTTYTKDDGLPSNAVTSIAVAPDGALWIGTEAGTVSRFDGQMWATHTISDSTGG